MVGRGLCCHGMVCRGVSWRDVAWHGMLYRGVTMVYSMQSSRLTSFKRSFHVNRSGFSLSSVLYDSTVRFLAILLLLLLLLT